MGMRFGPCRDAVVHAFAADCTSEYGSVVLIAHSAEDRGLHGISIAKQSLFSDRADIRYLFAELSMTAVDCIQVMLHELSFVSQPC